LCYYLFGCDVKVLGQGKYIFSILYTYHTRT
jgi:hypothetical protein